MSEREISLPYEAFEKRHIGPSSKQEEFMLSVLGYDELSSFISDVVPHNIVNAARPSFQLH